MLEIAELKKQYPIVFCTELENFRILFRPLTKSEYSSYLKISTTGLVPLGKLEDHIFREIVLDPSLVDMMMTLPAGVIPAIVGVAFHLSGNSLSTGEDVDRFNAEISGVRAALEASPYDQFSALICKAFPSYTLEDVERMPYPYFLKVLVMAEQILGREPIALQKKREKRSFTDNLFEDAKRAAQVDRPGGPQNTDIRNELAARQKVDRSTAMARQMETMNRIQQRRQQQ